MASDFDLIVRGGLIVDGTGGDPFEADIAVAYFFSPRSRREFDAEFRSG